MANIDKRLEYQSKSASNRRQRVAHRAEIVKEVCGPYVPFVHLFQEKSAEAKVPTNVIRPLASIPVHELSKQFAQVVEEFAFRKEEATARGSFLDQVMRAVAVLDGLVSQHPELWKPLATKVVQWPILTTQNPRIGKSQRQLLQRLELGREAIISMNWRARTSTDDAATRYALSILRAIHANRINRNIRLEPRAPAWVRRAGRIPPFNKATAAEWTAVGKQAFLEAVPEPEKVRELAMLAHAKETPAQKRALILERISRAIRSLAPAV